MRTGHAPLDACRAVILILAAITGSAPMPAQGPPVTHELRLDAVVARRTAVEAGGSMIVPAGIYSRTTFTAAGGLAGRDSAGSAFVGRVEVVSRFLLDPFRESPYGLSIGGGLGVTNIASGPRWRPYLAGVIDLELRKAGRLTPAIQLGLGGGVRLGISLRSGVERWR